MTHSAAKRPWLRRAGRVLLVLAIALPLLFLVASNAFLSLHGLDLLFASTNTINAKYQRAWMLWPGTIHVRGLRIIFQDPNVEWSLDFERATVDVSLLEFARRTFHAHHVRAEGGSFRMRHRIDPAVKNAPWVRTIAPIPEYPTPAVFEARVPEAPISDEEYNLWRVHLEDVDAQVDELWVQFVRYRGSARARGKFELRPARRLWVGPATLELAPGRLSIGEDQLAARLSGAIRCVVDPFDVRVPVGREVLRFINSDLKLRAEAFQPALLTQFFGAIADGRYDVQPGALDIDVRVRRGVALAGSSATLTSERVDVEQQGVAVQASGVRVHAAVDAEQLTSSTLEARAATVHLEPALPALTFETTKGELITRGSDLAGEAQLAGGGVDIGSFRVPDARALNRLLRGSALSLRGGEISGSLRGKAQGQQRSGAAHVRAKSLALHAAGLALAGDAKLDAHFSSQAERPVRADLTVEGKVPKLRISSAKTDGQPASSAPHGELHAVELRASATSAGKPGLSGKLELTAARAELLAPSRFARVRPRVELSLEDFDSARLSGKLEASLALTDAFSRHADETGQCSQMKLASGKLQLAAELRDGKAQGDLRGRLQRAAFDWGDFGARANANIRAELRDVALRGSGAGTVSFSLDVVDGSARSGKKAANGWQLELPKLSYDMDAWLGRALVGSARVNAKHVTGRIGGTHFSSDLQAKVPLFSADLARRSAHFSARLALRRTALDSEDRQVRDWWAELDVRSGLLRARENVDLSALFQAKLRDATPGIEILNAGGALPGWLAGLIPEQPVSAEGMVQRHCRLTEIRLTRAEDGPLAMHGRLQSESDATRGAFLVRHASVSLLSAGVAFSPDDTQVAPLAGDGWFREHDASLDVSAREVLTQPCSEPSKSCGAE